MKMYNERRFFCVHCLICCIAVPINTAPISTVKQVVEVTAIFNDSCLEYSRSVSSQSVNMLEDIKPAVKLTYLRNYLTELSDLCKTISKNNPVWLDYFRPIIPVVKNLITITPVRHCELSLELNSQVQVAIQLSIFANYIRSQEWDDDYGDTVKTALSQVKNKLYQAICVLKGLVQHSLSIEGIERYIAQDYTKQWVSLDGETGSIKRAFVMAEIEIFTETLETFNVTDSSNLILNSGFSSSCS